MTTLKEIKATVAEQSPVLALIDGTPSVIVGYDDERQELLTRPCGGGHKWVPYSALIEDAWVLEK